MTGRRVWVALLTAGVLGLGAAPASALVGPTLPTNDLQGSLALLGGQTPAPTPLQLDEGPVLKPVPRADCGPGSTPLDGMQGRVTEAALDAPQAAEGYRCNVSVVAREPTAGGFRTWRYEDLNGHACAFYDTSLQTPANVVSLVAGPSQGVAVLDMTDPAHPRRTALLTTPGMLAPHESLNLNAKRGLLGAETGSAGTAPAILDLYDVSRDCTHPELQVSNPIAPFGHESGFSPDGNTFWIAGAQGLYAIDVTNPKLSHTVWSGNLFTHGINFSDDGRTSYATNPIDGQLAFLDVSEVQDRKPMPQVRELSRLTWPSVSVPQNTNPMTIDGHPYLLEFDEFAFRFNPVTLEDKAGAARILDVADPARPRVTSDLRLEVNMQANHRAASGDPSFVNQSFVTYGAHYCNVPREVDPEIVACSFLNSGLRIFDVRDPVHPKEVAYFVAPPAQSTGGKGNAAFSQPAFDPSRRQVWYTDAASGFWSLELPASVWPHPTGAPKPVACTSKRRVTIRVRAPRRGRLAGARVSVGGKRVAVRRRGGRLVAVVDLRGRASGAVRVRVVARTSGGRTYRDDRTYRPCVRKA